MDVPTSTVHNDTEHSGSLQSEGAASQNQVIPLVTQNENTIEHGICETNLPEASTSQSLVPEEVHQTRKRISNKRQYAELSEDEEKSDAEQEYEVEKIIGHRQSSSVSNKNSEI